MGGHVPTQPRPFCRGGLTSVSHARGKKLCKEAAIYLSAALLNSRIFFGALSALFSTSSLHPSDPLRSLGQSESCDALRLAKVHLLNTQVHLLKAQLHLLKAPCLQGIIRKELRETAQGGGGEIGIHRHRA